MDTLIVLAGVLGVLLLGTMSPGPSFVLVARTAVARSRRDGLAAALGMGAGAAVFTILVLVGLTTLLARVPTIYAGLKIAGGVWLAVLAWRLWQGAKEPLHFDLQPGAIKGSARAFRVALATQLTNPKTAVYYGSVFAALLPQHPPLWFTLVLPVLIVALEAGWYSLVAVLFSAERPRQLYLRCKRWIDRAAGTIVGLLGLKLIAETVRAA